MKKYIFISLGIICVLAGLVNIVIPGLPTTPLLLLAAFLFSKSSPTLHQKLLNNKILGPYIDRLTNGFSIKTLLISISIMWTMIIISIATAFSNNFKMQMIMLSLGLLGTISQIIAYLKKKKQQLKSFEK